MDNPRANNIKVGQHILAQGVIFLPHYTERFSSNFELFLHMLSVGPVASNHGNLKKHFYLLWFKGPYGVHAEVNGTEGGEGGKRVR